MRNFVTGAFAFGLAAAAPASVWAQQHPEGAHPAAGSHPAPMAAHSPATSMHRPATAYHHVTYHHIVHHDTHHYHHVTVRHVAHPVATHVVAHGRANVAALRRNVTAVRRFHAGVYRAPPGYRYRRWGFGEVLPGVYFGRQFWITDWLAFGLFAPPDGLVWVRYGPDAFLIDQYTGEIIQVDYGVFY
jgi:Ni/Co efflux regulator RcnB